MVLLLLSATLIFALPYLPSNAFTQLLEYSIFLSPRWMFLLLLVPIIVFWQKLTKTYFLIFTLSTFIFIHFQDINFNINPSQETPQSIKLISLNMGGGSQGKYLETLMKRERPDIFLFQETYLKYIDNTFDSLWQYQCDNGLCIASQYPFNKVGEFSRRIFGGWGNFAAYYEVDINGKTLPLMNVHLETPRTLLSALINLSVNFKEVDNFYENKSLEASMISTWASSHSMFVM
ncbi:MAG: hypothetical protein ABJG28_05350, partial [Nonlabens ulvanivorans]|uniref:hypothetical protein n=1 Tax=Nonlabens ulvanivorans TaxID=906888 RepID=UPI003267377E